MSLEYGLKRKVSTGFLSLSLYTLLLSTLLLLIPTPINLLPSYCHKLKILKQVKKKNLVLKLMLLLAYPKGLL